MAIVAEIIQALVAWKLAIVLGWLALLFAAERLLPAVATGRGWFGDGPRLLRNLGLWAVTGALVLLIVLPVSAWAAAHPLWLRPDWIGGWPGLVVDVLILDLWIYWWHRANHEVPLLWRFHEVHHRDRFLDVTSQMRFHVGEVLISTVVRAAVIVVLAVPFASVLVFEILLQLGTVFHHSNLRLPPRLERGLSHLVVTPSIHWVHHHRVQADTDSNYCSIFAWWDRLFGTRSRTARTPDMEIGVEGRPELPLSGLLLLPFTRRGRAAG